MSEYGDIHAVLGLLVLCIVIAVLVKLGDRRHR